MGQSNSISARWSFIIVKDDNGIDCAVLHNPLANTVIELSGSSTGWFFFMDRSDLAQSEKSFGNRQPGSNYLENSNEIRGKYCSGLDASFEYRSLTSAPKALPALLTGDGEPMKDGWRLNNWSAMQEDAPLILTCSTCSDLRLVLTADGFILFPGGGTSTQALVARHSAVRVIALDQARREVSGARRPGAAGGNCCFR